MISTQKLTKQMFFIFTVFLLFIFTVSAINAASDVIDTGFDPAVALEANNGNVWPDITLQTDGKILVFGADPFNNIGGISKNKIARINPDGSFDDSFKCACDNFAAILGALVQPDGKIVISGYSGSFPFLKIARLNPDGSRDFTFNFTSTVGANAKVLEIRPDGKIYVSVQFSGVQFNVKTLYRLNSDGSEDKTFTPVSFDVRALESINKILSLPDGKVLIGGNNFYGQIFRINSDGTEDTTFETPNLSTGQPGLPPVVYDFGFQTDGKLVLVGRFSNINGIARNGFVRLNTDQSVDLQFSPTISANRLEILSDDKILTSNASTTQNSSPSKLNPDGTIDSTFSPTILVKTWILDDLERIIFLRDVTGNNPTGDVLFRANADGNLDPVFIRNHIGIKGRVEVLALQPDGKLLVGGFFDLAKGKSREGLARINSDGSLDQTFNPGISGLNINALAVLPDGKILVGKTSFNHLEVLTRLNPNGTVDSSFSLGFGFLTGQPGIFAIKALPNGKFYIGGGFAIADFGQNGVALLNSDGTLDTSFNPLFSETAFINSIIVQKDNKIVVGGGFNGVNGFNRTDVVRLNLNGSLDNSFDVGDIPAVQQIVRDPVGKYLILNFLSILRVNADGTPDNTWQIPTLPGGNAFNAMALMTDGSIIAVGNFTSSDGTNRKNIARFRSDGVADTLFLSQGTDGYLNDVVVQDDAKVIVGGEFTTIENIDRSSVARFSVPEFSRRTKFDFDGDGKSDVGVFRPSENKWYILRSSDFQLEQTVFAIPGDLPTPADFDGDGKTDIGIFRPSNGNWWFLSSINGTQNNSQLGQNGDIPLPSDFNGDGKADTIVYRGANQNWYRYSSASGQFSERYFGAAGDKPLIGDFNGDGKTDLAIFRPSTGDWWWQSSADNIQRATHWGISTDIPVPADYDGDGITDFAIYRPSEGGWYILNSSTGLATTEAFGISTDIPVPADYDGDGQADIAVFRPQTGIWYLWQSTDGFTGLQFGISTDVPIPAAFLQ